MASIRDIRNYLDAEIRNAVKAPLYKAKEIRTGTPKSPAGQGVTIDKNTVIDVTYDNRLYLVAYNRRDFMTWFEGCLLPGIYTPIPKAATRTIELLDTINKHWGFEFTERDIADVDIEFTTLNGVCRVIIPIGEDNPWFVGRIELPVWPTHTVDGVEVYEIDWEPRPLIVDNLLGDPTREVACASVLTYAIDYNRSSDVLSTISQMTDTVTAAISLGQATSLAAALRTVDKYPWVAVNTAQNGGSADYNLVGARCVYNGPTEAFNLLPPVHAISVKYMTNGYLDYDRYVNRDHKNVLVLLLNSNSYTSNLNGLLFIHYGGPSDAPIATDYKPPVHYWPLRGDRHNEMGGPDFAADIGWSDVPGLGKVAKCNVTTRQPIGASLPANGDYTIQITIDNSTTSMIKDYLFLDATTADAPGSISTKSEVVALTRATVTWAAPATKGKAIAPLETATITVVKKGNVYRSYLNGELVGMGIVESTVPAFTHIYGYPVSVGYGGFRDIYYYDYAMSSDLVKKLARGVYGKP